MRPAILFDIDGTLLHARGVGRGAFDRAFRAADGVAYPDMASISFIGATDLGVVRAMAEQCGVPSTPAREEHFAFLLAHHLEEGLTATPPHVYPGVPELLRALTARGMALGLVTGNVRATAWMKVRHAGVDDCFTFGGYGDEDPDRNTITRLALSRLPPDTFPALLVGDTPRDIEAAHRNGLKALAVGSGWISVEELQVAGADAVLPDFSAIDRSLQTIQTLIPTTVR